MDYRFIAYGVIGLIVLYAAIRLLGQYALGRLVNAELSHVIHGDEYKVKGKYD